jgi:hypothetical protein
MTTRNGSESMLEEAGFEPSVPRVEDGILRPTRNGDDSQNRFLTIIRAGLPCAESGRAGARQELADGLILVTYRIIESRTVRSSIWKRTNSEWRMVFHQGTKFM